MTGPLLAHVYGFDLATSLAEQDEFSMYTYVHSVQVCPGFATFCRQRRVPLQLSRGTLQFWTARD